MFGPANNKIVMSHTSENKVSMVSSLLNTASYLGLVIGVVLFQTIFNSYIASQNMGVERLTAGSAIHINVPGPVLLDGFQTAFTIGVIISIFLVIISLTSKENTE
jgi:DHA2 family metal-tetracycline-proton antiporter-like MFS transporter